MVDAFKKMFLGSVVIVIFAGIIAFIIALLLKIDDFQIIFNNEQRSDIPLVYTIYGLSVLLLVASLLFLLSKKKTGIFWTTLIVLITIFYIVWFPIYRETNDDLIIWITPSSITIVFSAIAILGLVFNLKIRISEKYIDNEIRHMYSILDEYWKLQDRKEDDKTCVNLIDGMNRKYDSKFYRLEYSIKEHDK